MEKSTPEGIRKWITEEFASTNWRSQAVAQELTHDILDVICMQYYTYDKTTKLGVLFSLLYIRKVDLPALRENMIRIFQIASEDADEWVRIVGNVLKDFPMTNRFNLNLQDWSSSDSYNMMIGKITNAIETQGFGFHLSEFMMMEPENWPSVTRVSESCRSKRPTIKKHFTPRRPLRKGRLAELLSLCDEEKRDQSIDMTDLSSTTPPITPTTAAFTMAAAPATTSRLPSVGTRPGTMPSRKYSTGDPVGRPVVRPQSNLFITRPPVRRPSGPSFLRQTNPVRFTSGQPRPPTTPIEVPKGFMRPSRTQMIDFNDATKLQQNNVDAIDKATQDLQTQQEARRQQQMEDRKRAVEEERRVRQQERETRAGAAPSRTKGRRRSSVSSASEAAH
ncbi:Negative elongation factor A [Apophysomyces sp. BC1015]|nr:Negative elongation factor A [Apophysomyces sp. BC1015]KAG0177429.1 Negative elongation factor A [Apophysomyces sp. BC1021]